VFRPSPSQVIDGTFGPGFFDAIAALPEGQWSGPVDSALGRHLVRVTERRGARMPGLAEVRDRVEKDWRATATQALRDARYEALLSRYEVVRPDPAHVLAP
jgi:parvulin-like peptidyl-prolyl isomerase